MSGALRLFIAIYPDEGVARSLLDRVRRMSLPAHRLTPARQVHLTVRFLGDTPPAQAATIAQDLERIAREVEPFSLRAERLITLPRTRARLLAATTNLPGPLARLIDMASLLPGVAVREGDPTPHLTLARFGRGVRVRPIEETIEAMTFAGREVHLVRSELGPAGATHASVRIAPFGGAHHQ